MRYAKTHIPPNVNYQNERTPSNDSHIAFNCIKSKGAKMPSKHQEKHVEPNRVSYFSNTIIICVMGWAQRAQETDIHSQDYVPACVKSGDFDRFCLKTWFRRSEPRKHCKHRCAHNFNIHKTS